MKKLTFLCLLAASLFVCLPPATATADQQVATVSETHAFEVVANAGSRVTVIKEFFSAPFKSRPKCTAEFIKPGIQPHEHGEGKIQEVSLMWIQILAEVGETVTYTCNGEKPSPTLAKGAK